MSTKYNYIVLEQLIVYCSKLVMSSLYMNVIKCAAEKHAANAKDMYILNARGKRDTFELVIPENPRTEDSTCTYQFLYTPG